MREMTYKNNPFLPMLMLAMSFLLILLAVQVIFPQSAPSGAKPTGQIQSAATCDEELKDCSQMLSQSMAEVRVLEVEKKLEILLRENAEKRLEKEEAARANLSIELKAKDETIKILTNLKCNQTSIFFGLFKKKTCY